ERLIGDVAMLHDSFARGLLMREGVHATIVGKPNVGKSSLMNLMLGIDRAIVTAIPGTTRDVVEDSVQLGPYALVLNDTAGIREATDDVERIGIERTLRSARDADLLIAMFDSSRPLDLADADVIRLTTGRPGLAILNKRDLPAAVTPADLRAQGLQIPILPFSAINLEEAATLRAELTKIIAALISPSAPTMNNQIAISRERHRDALAIALEALKNARDSSLTMLPPEIVAVDIMAAAAALGSITGEISGEDVLDAIFRDFCIGK
ncbi:MAG: GTPase, partial [Candidatus Binatus sp.]